MSRYQLFAGTDTPTTIGDKDDFVDSVSNINEVMGKVASLATIYGWVYIVDTSIVVTSQVEYNEDGHMVISGYELVCSCDSCPEQYEVYLDGNQVGYFRLRFGYFTANYTGRGAMARVYSSHPVGDGAFTDEERPRELTAAVMALHAAVVADMEGG